MYLTFPNLAENRASALVSLVKAAKEKMAADKLLYIEVEAPAWNGKSSKTYAYGDLAKSADCLVLKIAPYQIWEGDLMVAPMEPME